MRQLSSRLLVAALLLAVASPLLAVTYIVPPDREMIQRADDIVVATSVTSTVERTPRGSIVTRYILRIEEVLKGERERGSYVTLNEIGGELADLTLYVSGMPVYEPGKRYLVFTDANNEGDPITWGLELGQFALQNDAAGRLVALRNASGFNPNLESFSEPPARDAREFMKYIRAIVAQRTNPTPTYFVQSVPQAATANMKLVENFTRASYLVTGNPRWQATPNASVRTALTPSGANGVTSVTAAIGKWNATASSIAYSYFGQDDTAVNGFSHCGSTPCGVNAFDGKNTVLYDDPNGEVNPPVLGRGGYWSTGNTYSLGGETFKDIDGGIDVVVDNVTFSQCLLDVVVLHELGHTFGFRHSNQNPDGGTPCSGGINDCTSSAVMNSSVSCGLTTLQTWDQSAAAVNYGSGPVCTAPTIQTQPQSQTITQGQSANLSVVANGTAPFTYQWYIGSPSNTSSPTGTNSSSFNTGALSSNTTYWVRVTGCNSNTVDSNAAVITVNAPTCTPPAISSQPQDKTISQGNSVSLSVGATGTGPLTYNWFVGTPPNMSTPAGTGTSIIVSPSTTTSYWVRVTGNCGSPADSNAATVTVTTSTCPDVTVGTPTATQQTSGNYLLDVNASSGTHPLTYSWFQGPVPGAGSFIGSGKQILVPAPSAPVSYWVRVSNDCGVNANSHTVVTIAPCDLPVITTEPADQSISTGTAATLTVAFTSPTPAIVHWYRGTAPDKSSELGAAVSISTGPLTTTSPFWASIVNSCGEKFTRTLTVTVGTACTKPAISGTTAAQSKLAGQTVTLDVVATGTATLHYQWYEGVSGDESTKVGTDSSTFTSGPLTSSTKFWVKVTNDCGDASSDTISVNVSALKHRAVRH